MHRTFSLDMAILKKEMVSPVCKVWVCVVGIPIYFSLDFYVAYQLEFGQPFLLGHISK